MSISQMTKNPNDVSIKSSTEKINSANQPNKLPRKSSVSPSLENLLGEVKEKGLCTI